MPYLPSGRQSQQRLHYIKQMGKGNNAQSVEDVRKGGERMIDRDYLTELVIHAFNYTIGFAGAVLFIGSLPEANWSGICVGFIGIGATAFLESREPKTREEKEENKIRPNAKTRKVRRKIIKAFRKTPGRNFR